MQREGTIKKTERERERESLMEERTGLCGSFSCCIREESEEIMDNLKEREQDRDRERKRSFGV